MAAGMSDSALGRTVNALAVALINAPVIGGVVRRGLVVIRYEGRRSGKTFEIPVGYRRRAGGVLINVAAPKGTEDGCVPMCPSTIWSKRSG